MEPCVRASVLSMFSQGRIALAILLTLAASYAAPASAQTNVSGAINASTTWSAANSPYLVSADITIQSGAVLTIQPGTTIYMAAGRSVVVQSGSIQALGTAGSPILVSSDAVRTGGAGAPGQWARWVFNSGAGASRLEHMVFEFGQGLAVNGSAPVFNYLNLRNHAGAAISIDLAASPSGVGNQASGNTQNAVLVPAGDITGTVSWGLRGIPYLVSAGSLSVGASPAIASLVPTAIEQGETVLVTVSGERLTGASSATFSSAGLTAQIRPGATATQLQLDVTAAGNATVGATALTLLVDAGLARRNAAMNVTGPQFRLNSVSPSPVYLGQGEVQLTLNGSQFTAQAVALVNGVDIPTSFVSSTRLTATLPNQAAGGSLAVRVRMPDPLNAGQFVLSGEVALPVITPQLALAPASVTMVSGITQNLTLTLPYAAQAGGQSINLVSSVPGVATVPATITVPEGVLTATVPVTTLNVGSTTITASRSGFTSGQSVVSVIPPPTLTVAPASITAGVGRLAQFTVTSSIVAPAGGLVVSLASSNTDTFTVPATLTIAAGATSANGTLLPVAVGAATLTAQASTFVSGTTQVNVRPVSINFPAGAVVAPGLTRGVPVTLSDPAPAGGLTISLTSSNPAVLTVPATFVAPAGEPFLSIPVTGVAAGTATVTATATGYESGTLPVTVEAINITLTGSTTSIPVALSHIFNVTLSRPAPAGGIVVNLEAVNPALASVTPAEISIPEGQTSGGTVRASVTGVATGTTQIRASAEGLQASNTNVTITAQVIVAFSDTTLTVGRGMNTYQNEVYAYLRTGNSNYSPPAAFTVDLNSADPTRVSAPATLTFPAGQYYQYFRMTGLEITSGTPVAVTGSATGLQTSPQPAMVNVVQPQFTLVSLDNPRSPVSARDNFVVRTFVPGADYASNQTAAQNLAVDLSIVDANPAGIVEGIFAASTGGAPITQTTIAANNDESPTIYVGTPTAPGTYRVQANAPSSGAIGTSGVVTVTAPELRFSDTSITVGRGLYTYQNEVYLYRAVNGNSLSAPTALTVTLTSSDPTRVTVPATVTIPANTYFIYFRLAGADLTSGTPVTVTATADGYNQSVTPITVNVVTPQFTPINLDNPRSPASGRDDFRVRTFVPGADYQSNQTAVANIVVDLAIVEPNPAGIVDAIYSASTAGTAITQVTIPANDNESNAAFVNTPTVAGTYRVQASSAELGGVGTSGVVTVTAPELRFSDTTITVGRGLQTYQNEVYLYRAVNGNALSAATPLTVNLVSSDPTRASVPATVTIPANLYYVYFRITGVDLTSGTPVTIDATAEGYSSAVTRITTNVVMPQFRFQSLEATRTTVSTRDDFRVTTFVPGADYQSNQTAASDIVIDLSVVEADPAGIVEGFYTASSGGSAITQVTMPAGSDSSNLVYVGVPTLSGSYRVRADVPSTSVTGTSGVVTVSPPELRFSDTSLFAGRGMRSYQNEVYVYRAVQGNTVSSPQPVTVTLTCNSTAICSVPATVTIPANTYYVYFQYTGVGLGTTTITASAAGYDSVQDANVTVVVPALRINGLAANVARTASDNFTVGVTAPGADYSNNQTVVAPLVVSLTSSAPDVGTVPVSVTIQPNNNDSPNVSFTGVAAGTTTVTASSPDFTAATTNVTVTP